MNFYIFFYSVNHNVFILFNFIYPFFFAFFFLIFLLFSTHYLLFDKKIFLSFKNICISDLRPPVQVCCTAPWSSTTASMCEVAPSTAPYTSSSLPSSLLKRSCLHGTPPLSRNLATAPNAIFVSIIII